MSSGWGYKISPICECMCVSSCQHSHGWPQPTDQKLSDVFISTSRDLYFPPASAVEGIKSVPSVCMSVCQRSPGWPFDIIYCIGQKEYTLVYPTTRSFYLEWPCLHLFLLIYEGRSSISNPGLYKAQCSKDADVKNCSLRQACIQKSISSAW